MPGRHLSPEERALWKRVAASVRRTGGAASPVHDIPHKHGQSAPASVAPVPKPSASAPSPRPVRTRPAGPGHTLDGGWDRRIESGRLVPDRTVDLHGHTLAEAHARLESALQEAIRAGARVILLITGRSPENRRDPSDRSPRGVIRQSVAGWLEASAYAGAIAAVRKAHVRHGGAGALYVILRRSR